MKKQDKLAKEFVKNLRKSTILAQHLTDKLIDMQATLIELNENNIALKRLKSKKDKVISSKGIKRMLRRKK